MNIMNGRTCGAAAITGALAASAAQAATVVDRDGTTFDVYGNLQLAVSILELPDEDGSGDVVDELGDNGSTFGVLGERELDDGLLGYFRYEFEGDADEIKGGAGLDTGDQAYIGLRGGFGDVRIGSWDTLLDDRIQDPVSNNEFFDLSDSNGAVEGDDGVNTQGDTETDREGDKIQYVSPELAGFRGTVGVQYKGEGEDENVSGSGSAAPFLGVEYAAGPLSVAAVWDSLDNHDGNVTGRTFVAPDGTVIGEYEAGDQFGIAAIYELGGVVVAAKYEQYLSGDEDVVPNELRLGVGARHDYGRGDLYGAYQYVDVDELAGSSAVVDGGADVPSVENDESYDEFVVGATFDLSDSAYVFAEAAAYGRDDDIGNGAAFGAAYSF